MTAAEARVGLSSENAAWLALRGNDKDRELDDLTFLIHIPIALRLIPVAFPASVLAAASDHPRLRRARSQRSRIGAYPADSDWLTGSAKVTRPLLWRLLIAAAVIGGALGFGFPWWAIASLAVACFIMLAGPVLSVLAVVIGVLLLVLFPQGWVWTILSEYMAMMLILARKPAAALGGGALGPALGFVPLPAVLRMFLRGAWSSFSLGVDKAQSDDPTRAEPFLAAAEPRAGAYRAVISGARALVLARTGDTTAALNLLAKADSDSGLPATTRGWLAMVVSDVLAMAGQDAAALARLRTAIPLLTGRRARSVRIAVQLRLVDTAIKQGDYDLALETLTDLRWQAVRQRHLELVTTTEGFLVQMMLGVGNRSGALWTLEQISPRDARKAVPTVSGSRTALWNVLHAQVALEEGQPDEAERQAVTAVKRADLLADLGTRAAAHLILAEVRRGSGNAIEALPHVLIALDALQQVRYRLPASNWRRDWVRINTRAYELALEIAAAEDDPYLVAETIETIRAQAVPVGFDRTENSLETFLAALLDPWSAGLATSAPGTEDEESRATATALAVAGVDPIQPPAAIFVDGASWISRSANAVTDLDALITQAAGPDGWYWSACIGAGRYWWALRTSDGSWLWGSAGLGERSPARDALDDLLAALTIQRPEESAIELNSRIRSSPLWDTRNETQAESRLLERLTEAFLPAPLHAALADADLHEPARVLVSLNGPLAALPINALPLDTARSVIDAAAISHIPAPVLLAQLTSSEDPGSRRPVPITLAVVDPDPRRVRLRAAQAPVSATTVLGRPTTKQQLEDALRNADPAGVWCALAHYDRPAAGMPASGGVALADGVLSLRDLVPSGNTRVPIRVPQRVLLSMCESLAAGAHDAVSVGAEPDLGASTWEWLGLTAGLILAGARYVVATAWPLPDVARTTEFDHAIAVALTQPNPATAVREAILAHASPERRRGIPVLVWAAYSYVGSLVDADAFPGTLPQ